MNTRMSRVGSKNFSAVYKAIADEFPAMKFDSFGNLVCEFDNSVAIARIRMVRIPRSGGGASFVISINDTTTVR